MTTDPADVVREYWDRIFLDRDLDAIDRLLTDPSVRHTADGTASLSHGAMKRRIGEALRAVRGEEVSIDDLTVDGDAVWVRLTLRGVSLATMAPLSITWLARYRVVEGRIAEMWALHQSGLDWNP